jgi:hypothetical protein
MSTSLQKGGPARNLSRSSQAPRLGTLDHIESISNDEALRCCCRSLFGAADCIESRAIRSNWSAQLKHRAPHSITSLVREVDRRCSPGAD